MPSGLKRFQKAESLYFITFSCYRRRAACTLPSGAALGQNVWAQYNGTTNGTANNQMSATSINPNQGQPGGYDMAGDVLSDGLNQYLYDGEGRICASKETVDGTTVMTGYVYDADGARVAKGSITSWSCDPSVNGVATAGNETDYILGPGGEQVTELAEDANGSMNWQRTYVHGAGALIATYSPSANSPNQPLPSFRLTDWLGTMRATTDSAGVWQGSCTGLPFGDQANCQGNIPDPRHFTGKERDTESGNDYFGARYYASSMGRWMSPDKPFADQHTSNPQSWNLYEYGRNNPLKNVDLNGFKVLAAVFMEAQAKINALHGQGGTLYLDFAGIQGPHTHPSLNALNNFDRWHPDHFSSNSVVVPNNGIVSGFFRALFGLANKDQVDTGRAIVKAAQLEGQNVAFDTYSNGVNAAGDVARGLASGTLVSATIVGPNTSSPATLQAIDDADAGAFEIYQSTNDPALGIALFGSQDTSDLVGEFGGDVNVTHQPSHNLNRYAGANAIAEDAARQCAGGNPAACN